MNRAFSAAVFLVSFSVLVFEICAVRLFSVLFRYHYVFAAVSFSILGLGLGALLARWRGDDAALAWAAAGFGVAEVAALLLIFQSPVPGWFAPLATVCVVLILPFLLAGWFLAGVFSRWPQQAGRLYAADLAGAALGCAASVALMNWDGPVTAMLIGALCAAVGALVVGPPRIGGAATAATAVALVWGLVTPFARIEQVPLRLDATTKPMLFKLRSDPANWKILATEWDAFTRSDLVSGPNPDFLYVYTDGDTPTQMLRAGSVRASQAGLEDGIGFAPFHIWPPRQNARMLCIGAGGGLDVMIGRAAGVREIVAVDINRALPRLLEQFRDYHGDVYGTAGTRLQIAEGRSFLARERRRFDVIYLALTQTATATGTGMALAESYIHTIEAFADALRRLSTDGFLVCIFQEEAPLQRALLTAKWAVERVTGTSDTGAAHLAAWSEPTLDYTPYNHLLLVKREPLTQEDVAAIRHVVYEFRFRTRFLPGQSLPDPRASRLNLWPPHDDNPFFLDLSFGVPAPIQGLLFASAVATALLLALALRGTGGLRSEPRSWLPILVFFIGVGFMLVQNVAVQRFILFLGYPTLALSVVIVSMLLGGALGSRCAQRWAERGDWRRLAMFGGLIIPALSLLNYAAPALTRTWMPLPLAARAALAGMWLAPTGFLMGLFFPTALRLSTPRGIPLLWAVNGAASVFGAGLTLAVAKLATFTLALNLGLICYIVAVALLARLILRQNAGTSL